MALMIRHGWQLIIFVAGCLLFSETPAFAQKPVRRPGLHFGISST